METKKTTVAMSADFLTAFAKLPKNIQKKVTEFFNKFKNNPIAPGINYEKIENGADQKIYSVRIDDTYRGIVAREQETGVYLMLWVDHHDEAYDWAKRKRCEVNSKTGSIQIYDVQAEDTVAAHVTDASIFKDYSNDELLELAVPENQLSFVRSFTSASAFYAAKDKMPNDAFEYLSWLVEGLPISEVLDLAKDERGDQQQTTNISTALETPVTMKSFVVVEGEDELRRMMAEPLEKWRVFLHPTQRKIVNKNYSGPARVLGGAGTGKTVVAMHRAKHLASALASDEKILFTTFTANLASDIKENLRKICTMEELRKIEVINLDAWVNQYLRDSGYSAQIDYDHIKDLWEDAITIAHPDNPMEESFYEDEWNRVVIAQEALTLEKYVKASRNGRGIRLDRKKRMDVWKVIDAYQNLMKEHQVRDINMAMYECRKLLEHAGTKPKYKHIIVDEGQDFGNNAFRLLRTLAGEEHPNDLFIVGDAHQRIYKNKPTLSKCGINVRGRSSILKINYRTTEEIRRYAFALLNGISFDDLDDGSDLGDKCQSLTHGMKPEIKFFKDAGEEMNFLTDEIKKLNSNGVSLSNICIVARTRRFVDDYIAQLTNAGIRAYEIKRSAMDDRSMEGVRIATMHRVKGLEFQYVFVVAVNNRVIPLQSAIDHTDPVSEAETMTSEKCLLYVALTRAQKGAYITSYGKKSEFLV